MKANGDVESVVTFDKGATWTKFGEPLDCSEGACCRDPFHSYCHLQVHNQISMSNDVNVPQGPVSTKNVCNLDYLMLKF